MSAPPPAAPAIEGQEMQKLAELSAAAAPGEWRTGARCVLAQSTNPHIGGDDVVVSVAYSDRSHSDDEANCTFIAALVNSYRSGPLAQLRSDLQAARDERDEAVEAAERVESEAEDLRSTPWPDWAERCLKIIRAHSGYDGYDDADGVDLPGELEETLREYEREAEKNLHEARAKYQTEQAEKSAEHYRGKVTELCAQITAAESTASQLSARVRELEEALRECLNQLEYQHEKFGGTGSGDTIMHRTRAILSKGEGS